jgi:hypothetical protein
MGNVVLVGPEQTSFAQLAVLSGAVKLEALGMSRRGPSALSIAKRIGYRGNRTRVAEQLQSDVAFLIEQPRRSPRVAYLAAACADQGAGWYIVGENARDEWSIWGGRYESRGAATLAVVAVVTARRALRAEQDDSALPDS